MQKSTNTSPAVKAPKPRARGAAPSKANLVPSKAHRAAKALLRDVGGSGFVMTVLTIASLGIATASLVVSMSQQQRSAVIEEPASASVVHPLIVHPVYRIDQFAPVDLRFATNPIDRQCELAPVSL
ncbi:MAG: hypothetical protein V4574_04730 [Pseudomonadota bacterium]